jgi:hypothetical protein
MENPWTRSTLRGPQLQAGPRWTHTVEWMGKLPESGRDGAPACRCSPTAAGKGKGGMGTHHGVHRSSGSGGVAGRLGSIGGGGGARWGVCSDVGEEERGMVSGAGCSGAEVPLL